MIIFCDMDGVVANIIDHWLEDYNIHWDDNITADDLKTFALENHVKPECGGLIFDFIYKKDFFKRAKVYEGSQEYLKKLKDDGHEIYFATSSPVCIHALIEKHKWIDEHFDFIGSERVITIKNKGLLNGDILIDDWTKNLKYFEGMRILFKRPWNRDAHNGTFLHVESWKELYEEISKLDRSKKNE